MSSAKVCGSRNSTTSYSYAAEKIASNDDLLTEILTRLPIKSILKFKTVSKHWLSLISNPDFCRRFYPTAASGLFFRRLRGPLWANPEYDFIDFGNSSPNPSSSSSGAPFRSLNFVKEDQSRITIMQSCNGLLLCCDSCVRGWRKNHYVYNPTTNKYRTLPLLPSHRGFTVFDLVLSFDPLKSPHFKVVCVWTSRNDLKSRFEIFSSQGGPWRLSARPTFSNYRSPGIPGVYWNGAVHWISAWHPSFYFKIEEEQLCPLPMLRPPLQIHIDNMKFHEYRYFGESRDHLYLIDYMYEPGETHLNVFEMERDYSEWSLKFRVDLSEISNVFPEMIINNFTNRPRLDLNDYHFSVLSFVRGEHEEDSYLVLSIRGKVLRYNFGNKTFYKLCDIDNWGELLKDVYKYIESLAYVCRESKPNLRSRKYKT